MQYQVYDNSEKLRGQFESIYDMEIFMDAVRNQEMKHTQRQTE